MKRWSIFLGVMLVVGIAAYFVGPLLFPSGWRIDYEEPDKGTGKPPKLAPDEAALQTLRDDFQESKSPRPSPATLKKIKELAAGGTQGEGLADLISDWQGRMFDAGLADAAEFRELAQVLVGIFPDAARQVVAHHYDAWNARDRDFAAARLVSFGEGAILEAILGLHGEAYHAELTKFPSRSRLPVALAQFGAKAVPALRDALKNREPHVRRQAVRALALMGPDQAAAAAAALIEALDDTDGRVRFLAVLALGEVLPANTALPDRVAALLDDKESAVRLAAARSLGRHVGAPTDRIAATLIGLLRENNFDNWYWAVALDSEPPARPLICQGVPWTRVFYEELTAYLLVELDLAHTVTPAAAVDLLRHCKHQGRHLAILLAAQGDKAKETVPALLEMLSEADGRQRCKALCLLSGLGKAVNEPARTEIAKALDHADPKTRWRAYLALAALDFRGLDRYVNGPAAHFPLKSQMPAEVIELRTACLWRDTEATLQPAVRMSEQPGWMPWLRSDILASHELALRHGLVNLLLARKTRDKAAVPLLVGMWLDTPEPPWAGEEKGPLDVLAAFGPDAAEAAPHLVAGLRHSNTKAVTRVLVTIGDAVLPPLARALADPKNSNRQADLLAALQAFGPKGKIALPTIIKALNSADEEVRRAAAETFGTLGPAAKDAVPEARKLLTDSRADVRRRAAQALGYIGSDAAPALPELIDQFRDADADARAAAVRAAASIGKIAVAPLTAALDDSDGRTRLGAVEALEAIGPEARPALPILERLAQQDPEETVRTAARLVVQKLRAK
jgi:HEAT repeat protein